MAPTNAIVHDADEEVSSYFRGRLFGQCPLSAIKRWDAVKVGQVGLAGCHFRISQGGKVTANGRESVLPFLPVPHWAARAEHKLPPFYLCTTRSADECP